MSEPPVITVDGPSGSGKGTLAAALAERLGWHYLDSGALYRIVAWAAIARGLSLEDAAELAAMAGRLGIEFVPAPGGPRILVDGTDRSDEIRTETVSAGASRVAILVAVRQAVLEMQRRFRRPPGLVTDGRDMGTVVFPDAALKIFLEASVEERARRRYNQLKDKGFSGSLRDLLISIAERDQRDRTREVSPLVPADDAVVLDGTELSAERVLDAAWDLTIQRRLS